MNPTDHYSLWLKTTAQPTFQPVDARHFDLIVVGAGIVGVSLAFNIRGLGARVLLIEGDEVLQGVTGYTTGKLTAQHNLIYSHLAATRDEDAARAYYEAQKWAIGHVDMLTSEFGIDCDLIATDASVFSTDPENDTSMEDEAKVYERLGIPGSLNSSPDYNFRARRLLTMRDQRHFHPRKYLLGLLKIAAEAGVQVMAKNRVHQIDEEQSQVVLETEHGRFTADRVAVTTHYPIHDSGFFMAKLTPKRSYATAFRMKEMPADGMFISHEAEPLRSWRPAKFEGEDVLIVGSTHHKVGEEPEVGDAYQELETWARLKFSVEAPIARWSTQDNWTPDGVPFIGRSPSRDRIWLATGFGGWGMTNGIAGARLIADQIEGRRSPWEEVFAPDRLSLEMVPKLVKDNLNTAGHLIGDRLSRSEDLDLGKLEIGAGVIAKVDGDKRAVYRGAEGLCILDPACTHMGCQVAWNELESTWDCPCHGSRFKPTGEVIHGPATNPLKPAPPRVS